MSVELEWSEPIALRSMSEKDIARVKDLLDKEPGIYVFARRWGKGFEALYVGQAANVCVRVVRQLNNRKLVEHVERAKIGAKVLLVGYLNYQGNTNRKKALGIAEKAYIRYAISQGHFLHNTHGTRINTEEVLSSGKSAHRLFPKRIEVEL